MKIQHSLVLTRDNDETWFEEMGLQFPFESKEPAKALFGIAGKKAALVTCEAKTTAHAFQARRPMYHQCESECEIGLEDQTPLKAREAEGWANMSNGSAGMVVAVRDFVPQFPKELTADRNGITAKLWNSRDGRALDYNTATLVKDWWDEWAEQVRRYRRRTWGSRSR